MARITIDLPDTVEFVTTIPLRIGDINYGGHLGNDIVLSLVHEARVRFLRSLEYSEHDIEGCAIIMSDAAIVYRREARYGDVIDIAVSIGDFSGSGCDLFYRLSRHADQVEVARVKTGIVFFDYERGKPLRVPQKFRERIEKGRP